RHALHPTSPLSSTAMRKAHFGSFFLGESKRRCSLGRNRVSREFDQYWPHYSDIYFRNSFVQNRPDSRRMNDCRTTASFRHLDRVEPLFLAALFWQAVQQQWPPSTSCILAPAAPFRLRGLPPRC